MTFKSDVNSCRSDRGILNCLPSELDFNNVRCTWLQILMLLFRHPGTVKAVWAFALTADLKSESSASYHHLAKSRPKMEVALR